PAADDSDLAAKNAAPSWETGAAAGGATASISSDEEAPAPQAEATEAPAADATGEATPVEEGTEATPAAEAPSTQTAAQPATPTATGDSDLAAKNAAPSWETGAATPAPATEAPVQ